MKVVNPVKKLIAERTNDGEALVELALNIVEGKVRGTASTKMRAVEYLSRLYFGNPKARR